MLNMVGFVFYGNLKIDFRTGMLQDSNEAIMPKIFSCHSKTIIALKILYLHSQN